VFHRLYEGAVQNTNEFKAFRVDWWDVPGRDQKWKDQTVSNTSELQFEQEFGNSFHGTSNTLISSNTLLNLKAQPPLNVRNDVFFYENPIKDHRYIMTVDVSKGRGQDYSTFNVIKMDDDGFHQVCTYRNNLISPMIFPDIIVKIASLYNDALVIIENNDAGQVVCNHVYYDYEYDNTFVSSSVKSNGIGVMMTKRVKRIGCSNLKDIIELSKLRLVDSHTIDELTTFEIRKGSYSATVGNHDDLVMNLVMFAWFISSDAFGDLSDVDLKTLLYEDRVKQMEEDITPVGIIDDKPLEGSHTIYEDMVNDINTWNNL
jgi:hypothetical protein